MPFKSKKFWIISAIVLVVVVAVILSFSNKQEDYSSKYEMVEVERGDLVQTVEAAGTVKAENEVSLHFETNGTLEGIYVIEGEEVKRGDILANLSLEDFDLAIRQAEANLEQKKAGATEEQIAVSSRQMETAEVSLKKAETNLDTTIALAEEGLQNKYISALDLLDDSYIKLFDGYKEAEYLINAYFGKLDQDSYDVKYEKNYNIKEPMDEAKEYLDKARESQTIPEFDEAIQKMDDALKDSIEAFLKIREICDHVNYKDVIASADKTAVDTLKTALSTAQISLTTLQNEISLLKLQNTTNIENARLAIEEANANLELQKANHASLIADPREVDIAYYEALLDQAIANRKKAILYAPIDGVVTKINKKSGELTVSTESLMTILSPQKQIEVNIPETDVVKLEVGDPVEIEVDALSDTIFEGEILTIDPSATTIQDVVYYKVVINMEDDDRIKPGMTVDIIVETDKKEGVLFLPSRAILTQDGERYVRIIDNGSIIEKGVEIGLNADDSKREIISGLSEGDEVVLKVLD